MTPAPVASGTTHQTIYFPEVKAFHALLPESTNSGRSRTSSGSLDDKIESNRRLSRPADELIVLELSCRERRRLAGGVGFVARQFVNGGAYTNGATGTGAW